MRMAADPVHGAALPRLHDRILPVSRLTEDRLSSWSVAGAIGFVLAALIVLAVGRAIATRPSVAQPAI
jgi:hypothetical protein